MTGHTYALSYDEQQQAKARLLAATRLQRLLQDQLVQLLTQQRNAELATLQEQYEAALAGMASAQREAALSTQQLEQQREARRLQHLQRQQEAQQRFAAALARVQNAREADLQAVLVKVQRRQNIMQTHRQLAKEFTEQQKQAAAAEAQQQAEVNLQEEQRRRQNQVSRIDFRYSRLHEMGVPQLVTNNKDLHDDDAMDAATQAQHEASRTVEEQARRQQQQQENARKAADRGISAQMLLQAERNRQRMEHALQEMESNAIQQRQQDLAAGKASAAPLLRKWQQQRRKAQARRAFERDFLPGPAAEARMEQGLPSFLTAELPHEQAAAAAQAGAGRGLAACEYVVPGSFQHPNIVKMEDTLFGDELCIMLEWCQGGSLRHALKGCRHAHLVQPQHQQLVQQLKHWPARLQLLSQATEAVSYLHGLANGGVLHNDLRADTLLLQLGGTAGACTLRVAPEVPAHTSEDDACVTLRAASDVYSLAALMVEVLTAELAHRPELDDECMESPAYCKLGELAMLSEYNRPSLMALLLWLRYTMRLMVLCSRFGEAVHLKRSANHISCYSGMHREQAAQQVPPVAEAAGAAQLHAGLSPASATQLGDIQPALSSAAAAVAVAQVRPGQDSSSSSTNPTAAVLFLTQQHLAVVLEGCSHQNLLENLQQRRQQGRQLSEAAAHCLFQQVVLAVDYCHSQGLNGLPMQHTLLQESVGRPPMPKVPCPLLALAHSISSRGSGSSWLGSTALWGRFEDMQGCGMLLLHLLGGQMAPAAPEAAAPAAASSSRAVLQLPKGRSAGCQVLLQQLLAQGPAHVLCSTQRVMTSTWCQQGLPPNWAQLNQQGRWTPLSSSYLINYPQARPCFNSACTVVNVGLHVAVQRIARAHLQQLGAGYLPRDILCHSQLRAPHVVQFREVFESAHHINIVMDYARGGSLFDYSSTATPLPWQQLRGAELQVIHRRPCLVVKICILYNEKHDKGAVTRSKPVLSRVAGSQRLSRAEGAKATVAGTVERCIRSAAFHQPNAGRGATVPNMKAQDYHLPDSLHITLGCRALLRALLHPDHMQRAKIADVMADPRFQKDLPPDALNMNAKYLADGRPCPQTEFDIQMMFGFGWAAASTQVVQAWTNVQKQMPAKNGCEHSMGSVDRSRL
ncbi:hypothetical protein COO60DRAFT_1458938 [Scenedesmus sp. NREL 46B-D3]|nr:hypothetical protein COO60DRAFT_1458938 [Scenedesmus sp. NREL 46B-D3]